MIALRCAEVAFAYPEQPELFSALNFSVHTGERVGIIGANGAGKTTLFHLLCGLLRPQRGTIERFGNKVDHARFSPDVGLVFQHADDQLFCPTVREDVAFGVQNLGLAPDQVQQRVAQTLAQVGASELIDRIVHQLSGGEKRLVSIAGVLAMQPQLMLFDEPSAGLDLRNRRRLIDLLATLDLTILIASHDLELLLDLCPRLMLLDRGKLIADGDSQQIMANAELMQRHGQEVPCSLRFKRALNNA